jgi:predicted Zn-dependent protease
MNRLLVRIVAVMLVPFLSIAGVVPALADIGTGSGMPRLTLIRDAETETMLRTFANPLFRAAGVDPNLVRIILIQDSAINSFVSTGNLMFINTGLLMKAESALELVGVIAHETGHIAGGHLTKLPEVMREAMIESIAAMLVGVAAGVAGRDSGSGAGSGGVGVGVAGQQMAQRNLLSFTRGMERSADQGAMTFLDANHWSAEGLLDLFKLLEGQEALMTGQDPYLLTHPLTKDRIEFVANHVAHSPYAPNSLPPTFEPMFQMVKAKLQGFLAPSSETLRLVRETDRSAPARYARAIALYRLGHLAEALPMIDQLIAEQPGNPWLLELKGQVLFENGRVRESIAPYQSAIRLAPEQPLIHIALGQAMVETGDPLLLRPAVQQLQSALDRDHDAAQGWRELATAWGKLGNAGEANLALAEEAMVVGDIATARMLASRAQTQLPPGPAKLRALDISNAVKKENRDGF